jgi:hypothetical protein
MVETDGLSKGAVVAGTEGKILTFFAENNKNTLKTRNLV